MTGDTASHNEAARPAPRSWAMRAAGFLALLGLGLALIPVFSALSKPDETGFGRFRTGALTSLVALPDPPAQPQEPFSDAAGEEVRLGDFAGEVVVLNLWGTFCPPCVEEMPTLAALHRRFEGKGARVVAVSFDQPQDAQKAKTMLETLGGGALDFYIEDASKKLVFDLKAKSMPVGFPTTVVYDRQGREVARMTAAANWDSPEAVALIAAALDH